MANYANLKAAINAVIKQNGQGEITGEVMNQVLMAMVNSLGDGYLFMGVATPYTNPEVPDQNVFYLAVQAGTYSNFNSAVVPHGITILKYGGNGWSSDNLLTFDTAPNKTSENPLTNKAITIHGSAFDISELNKVNDTLATYASLSAAIAAIPDNIKRGGMSIKFVQSSDNKYVKFFCTAQNFITDVTKWQGVDDVPTAESDNLISSKGAYLPRRNIVCNVNGYLNENGIVIGQGSQWFCSALTPVIEGTKYVAKIYTGENTPCICFYDENEEYLSRIDGTVTAIDEIEGTVPQGACYLRVASFRAEAVSGYSAEPYYFSLTDANNKITDDINKNRPVEEITYGGTHPVPSKSIYSKIGGGLFNVDGFIYNNGTESVATPSWKKTDYIPVFGGDVVSLYTWGVNVDGSAITALIAMYDVDKKFVSAVPYQGEEGQEGYASLEVTIPNNVKYIKSCGQVDKINNCYLFVKKTGETSLLNKVEMGLFDCIEKPIEFKGKKLTAFGDSITYGIASPNLQYAGDNKYISLFCEWAGATLNNLAVSGACIANGMNGETSIHDTITSFTDTTDIIIIAGGINDWQLQTPIGNFSDTLATTFYGALNRICSYLKTNYSSAKVIFITPIPTTSLTTFNVVHPDNQDNYRKAISDVAAKNGYSVIDGSSLGLPNKMDDFGNIMFDPSDRLHPTILGHKMYAIALTQKLLYTNFDFNSAIVSKGYTFTTTTPVDLNDLKENSFRYLNGSGISNKPSDSSTDLYILSAIGQEGQYPVYEQILFDITNGKIYTRRHANGWDDWKLFYGNEQGDEQGDLHVGTGQTYASLTQAIVAANNLYLADGVIRNVIVHPGEYDLISEGATSLYDGYGLKLYCNVIGSQGAKVVARPSSVNENFSPFYVTNAFNVRIENITIEIENCRYCVHDEMGTNEVGSEKPNSRLYKNVHFINHGWTAEYSTQDDITRCIGCGLGGYVFIEVADCLFESDETRFSLVDVHSAWSDYQSSPSKVLVHGCYFKNGTVSGTSHGDSGANYVNEMYVYGNSFTETPYITNNQINMKLYSWNNEIRQ